MPLVPDPSSPVARSDRGFVFQMSHSEQAQACLVTNEALQDLRTKHHADALETSEDEIFNACRSEIERIASQKFDDGLVSDDGILEVRAQDIP